MIYDKEVGDLYFSPNIRTIKSRRVRWAGHVARIEEKMAFNGEERAMKIDVNGRLIWKE